MSALPVQMLCQEPPALPTSAVSLLREALAAHDAQAAWNPAAWFERVRSLLDGQPKRGYLGSTVDGGIDDHDDPAPTDADLLRMMQRFDPDIVRIPSGMRPFILRMWERLGNGGEHTAAQLAHLDAVDAELDATAAEDARPLDWYAATETAAEEYELDGEFVRALFVELLPAWVKGPEETHLLIEVDSLIQEDDYGVYGSDFYRCRLCQGESGAGVLNKGIEHEESCPLADSNYAKAVEKTRQVFGAPALPASAALVGAAHDPESIEQGDQL